MSSFRIATTLAALFTAAVAQAAPGLATVDADLLDSGRCQSDSAFQRKQFRVSGDHAYASDLSTSLSCGLGLNSQLGLEVRHQRNEGWIQNSQGLVGRTKLAQFGQSGPQISLLWGLERHRFSSDEGRHSLTASRLGLAMSQEIGAGRVYGSLSHTGIQDSGDVSDWRVGYQHRLNDSLQLHYEASGASHQKPTHTVGAAWNLNANTQIGLDLSQHRMAEGFNARSATMKVRFGF